MRRCPAFLLALSVAACATPEAPREPASVTPQPQSAAWTITGRVAVKSGENNLSGQFEWQHRGANDELLLSSPLGQGVARIVRDAEGVVLERPNEPLRRAADAESLTQAALGYTLPLSGLVDWIQGQPDAARLYERRFDADGKVAQIRQDGWVIDYLQYLRDAPERPRKLIVTHDELEIRLVIDAWKTE